MPEQVAVRPDQVVDATPLAAGTLYLIFIQVASRALTFVGNQFLLRYLSPSLLGIAVQLELLSTTVLYSARESLRVALQRQSAKPHAVQNGRQQERAGKSSAGQSVVNLSYLVVALGGLLLCALGSAYLVWPDPEVTESPYFGTVFRIYAVATFVELLSEPSFVIIQQYGLFGARARAETSAAIMRCFAACITAVSMHGRRLQGSVLPFAIGQLAYSSTLLLVYLSTTYPLSNKKEFSLLPRTIYPTTAYAFALFDKSVLSITTPFYLQSIFKYFLTQGDTLILSFLSTLADQGAFSLASNYGGLLARLVFQPIEESSRNAFGRLTASSMEPKSRAQALRQLSTTLHFYLLMALPLFAVAPYVLPVAVSLLIGTKWQSSSTSSLLSAYCYYIPFMAVNGILDAFVTSVATPAQLGKQSVYMAAFTGAFGLAAWYMLKKTGLGAAGLVIANVVNMALRIVWSISFINQWTRKHERIGPDQGGQLWKDSIPALANMVVATGVWVGLRAIGLGKDDIAALDAQKLGYVIAGIVVLGSTM